MKKTNVSIFVPHMGCPCRCSFCNQKAISGQTRDITREDVESAVNRAVETGCKNDSEIAFFGGSFTAIEREKMLLLLDAAYPYVKNGSFSGIRISTRPDAVDSDVLEILKSRGVTAVELGAQSMDDGVLKMNRRGHTAKDVYDASGLIRESGISLGLQMMTGLYGSSGEKDLETLEKIISLCPDTLRIYPTVTLEKTYLAELYRAGKYTPPELEETVDLCALMLERLEKTDIKLIRLGLHSEESMERDRIAGPYHPAFGQLCVSRLMRNKALQNMSADKINLIYVNPKDISSMLGQKRLNIKSFEKAGYSVKILTDSSLPRKSVVVKNSEREKENVTQKS